MNQNFDYGQSMPQQTPQQVPQQVPQQPQMNYNMGQVPQQPMYAPPMPKKPLLDDTKVETLTAIGTGAGMGFCSYMIFNVVIRLLSRIYEGVTSYNTKANILDIVSFINKYVLTYVPIIITVIVAILIIKYNKNKNQKV